MKGHARTTLSTPIIAGSPSRAVPAGLVVTGTEMRGVHPFDLPETCPARASICARNRGVISICRLL